MLTEVFPSGGDIADTQGEVPRTDRVGLRLEQQVELLVAEVEPEGDEVERPRLGDFLEAEHVAIELSAPLDIGDQNGNVIDLRHFQWHFPPRIGAGVIVAGTPARSLSVSRSVPQRKNV
jgi:hypothetical protein